MPAEYLVLILLLCPLVGAIVGFFLGRWSYLWAQTAALAASAVSLMLAWYLATTVQGSFAVGLPWFAIADLRVGFGLLYTPLAATMLLIVALVGLMVNIFSVRYLHDDPARARYFAAFSLFVFAMFGLVLADNLVMLFAFWELVGFCSYLLIGHYGTTAAGAAANKAFIVNRIGDVFFLGGIIAAYLHLGTVNILELWQILAVSDSLLLSSIAGLLFFGVAAKSAQIIFHIWLPDAMAGPTPVSALIHAATMVAAGVFLLCRIHFVFEPILPFISVVGCITAFAAALWAFGQSDIKRVLAYSTISQLGFMVTAFGLGSPQAAFFHLSTHAFFKALLFLAAGAIIAACHHQQDAQRMGGLWRRLPFTFIIFIIGALALAGFPFTAGFYSKDSILAQAQEHAPAIFGVLLLTSLLTAMYMGRLIGLIFFGQPRSEDAAHAREGDFVFHGPLVFLSFAALAAGAISFYPAFAGRLFAHLPHPHHPELFYIWGVAVVLVGAVVAAVYARATSEPLLRLLGQRNYASFTHGFRIDQVLCTLGQLISGLFSRISMWVDQVLLGRWIGGAGTAAMGATAKAAGASYLRLLTYTLYIVCLGAILYIFLLRR